MDGHKAMNGQAAVCVREGSSSAGLSPEAHGPMGPMRLRERRRATGNLGLQAQASYPPCGFGWLWPHSGFSWDPSKPGVTCDLAPGRPPRTLLWTQGHME